MSVTRKDIEYIAELAKLKFNDQDLDSFTDDLNEILNYIEKLNEINTDNIEPLSHPIEGLNSFREDIVKPSLLIQDALKNAPEKDEAFFKVPKVISIIK